MIRVLIHCDSRYPVNRKVIKKAVTAVFLENNLKNLDAEVSVAIVGERKMRNLCKTYVNDTEKHAVLAFAYEDASDGLGGFVNPPGDILRLGDVVLCFPYAVERAAGENVLVNEEVKRLITHGVKHLLGENHNT